MTVPDNWRPPGASDHAGWKVITRVILAVDSRTAYMSSYNIAAELEAVRAVNEMLAASGNAVAWLYESWNGGNSWGKHFSFDKPAGNKWQRNITPLYAAPSKPAPDAMRKALVTEIRNHVAWTMCSEEDLFDRIVKTLSAPVPSPDGAGEMRDNRHCPNGLEHGRCLFPDCVSSCPGRLSLSPSATGAATLGLTIAQMERAAKACRDKYCELMSGKRTWVELTADERSIAMVSLSAAFSAVSVAVPDETEQQFEGRIFKQDAQDVLRLIDYIADKIGLPHNEELSRDNFNKWFCTRAPAVRVTREAIAAKAREWESRKAYDEARLTAALSDQVVVPREPTDEMICAGDERIIEALQHHELIAATPTPAEKCYRAMIAVCTPPQPSEDNGPDTNGGER